MCASANGNAFTIYQGGYIMRVNTINIKGDNCAFIFSVPKNFQAINTI